MKAREMIRLVERDGWQLQGFTGSPRQFVHPTKPGKVTIPGHPSTDLHRKTTTSIADMLEAIAFHLQAMAADGDSIPEGTGPGVYVEHRIEPAAA